MRVQLLIIVHFLAVKPQVLLGGFKGPLALDFPLDVAKGVGALERKGELGGVVLDSDAHESGHDGVCGCCIVEGRKFEDVIGRLRWRLTLGLGDESLFELWNIIEYNEEVERNLSVSAFE